MASGIFAVLDDIAALMDDVAVASKIAGRKTAAILGDDLAVNAEKATGFVSSREIPVLWAITKGSFLNKLIIVPIALLLNSFFPAAITYILIMGGLYLAYEGAEKIIEFFFHRDSKKEKAPSKIIEFFFHRDSKKEKAPSKEDLEAIDKDPKAESNKIRSAIITDFILSVEIVIIALSSVQDTELTIQIVTVSAIALLATIGVYGLVALIVRMDDLGYRLIKKSEGEGFLMTLGKSLVKALPWIVKALSIIGTIALFMVSGGIFDHNIPFFHEFHLGLPDIIKQMLLGLVIGLIAVSIIHFIIKLFGKNKPAHS